LRPPCKDSLLNIYIYKYSVGDNHPLLLLQKKLRARHTLSLTVNIIKSNNYIWKRLNSAKRLMVHCGLKPSEEAQPLARLRPFLLAAFLFFTTRNLTITNKVL
jgi:hypothetical protein